MDVHKTSVLSIFDNKQQLEVPLFQRQYVWSEDEQWQPLWEDIERKFREAVEGRTDGPVHFLGAMVLDQKQTPTGHVLKRQVIDGQQRLTTLQIFLAAFRDFLREHASDELAVECEKFVLNTGMMADREVDCFKVWPTQADREQYRDVITSGSRHELETRHPLVRRKYHRKPEPRPRMIEAYVFFHDQLTDFFLGEDADQSFPVADRAEECLRTLKHALMVAVIDLDQSDDPQMIFETLNARGQPLLPADLLRNYLFLRASRDGFDSEALYRKYWTGFDTEFWRTEVKQGRLTRPRSDLFMQHFLASRQGQEIPIKHLYVEYRHWIEVKAPFKDVEQELQTIARQREHFRRILAPDPADDLAHLSRALEAFDVRTAYPLLLSLLDVGISSDEWESVSVWIESYLVRRAVCQLTTKNYNRVFLSLARLVRDPAFSVQSLRQQLLDQSGASVRWPTDSDFRSSWMKLEAYEVLGRPRLLHILKRLNDSLATSKNEAIAFDDEPSLEHIMPQSWQEHWPLADGSMGMSAGDAMNAPDDDPVALSSAARASIIHTIGNLTLLSKGLNAAQSNLGWAEKRPEMARYSLLPINSSLLVREVWDEAAIENRATELFERAIEIWPR